MINETDVPPEGVRTEERVWGRHADVWWEREVFLAFPTVGKRGPVLTALETEMISCDTATLYYHAAEIGEHVVLFESSDAEGHICINVRLAQPLILSEEEMQMLREFYAEQDAARNH